MIPPTSLFTQKCMQKEDNAFCFTARYFISIIPSKSALLFHDAHFFSSRKCYLDKIVKFKLGQKLGRYVVLSFARKFCVLYFIFCPKYSIFPQDMS